MSAAPATVRHRIGIEQLSVFGLPPVAFVELAAELGCDCVSLGLTGFGYNPHGYAPFSLREDAAMRRELGVAMRACGVALSLGEGFTIRPGRDITDLAGDMDVMAELGAERLNAVSLDPDLSRARDQFGVFAEMAAARGMVSTIEACPVLVIATIADALAVIAHVGRPDFRLLLDMMHLGRAGTAGAEVAAVPPELIDYVQVCDAPLRPSVPDYMIEATFERMVPGTGDMPLDDYAAAIPDGVTVSLEMPMRSLAEAGIGPAGRLRPGIKAMRALFGRL